ncbi:MAG: DotI/IcmL/TraM family protein [Marinospirillum sp.]|uniref:DotI/IcmL family type IV secretion protein n=1 Tax=Marinospirillum sp. TaxID=2183934 RepID=UPI0019F19B1F|nr:DotI/IcmL family type IV secretion protein [Marinospirillum sp.]MBE0506590.1 DotI/IcmL/TraM family protein [Marinospirillum sp.]
MPSTANLEDQQLEKDIAEHRETVSQAVMLGQTMSERYVAVLRNSQLKSLMITILSAALFMSIIAAGAGWSRAPAIKYFYLTEDGVAIEVEPLTEPNRSAQSRSQFVSRAFIDLFDFSYLKVGEHFDRIAPEYMTTAGRVALMNALSQSGIIKEMQDRHEIATLIPEGNPTVFGEGISSRLNVYVWAYHMPIRIRLDGPQGIRYKTAVARFTLARVPPHAHVRGLLIDNVQLLTPEQARVILEQGDQGSTQNNQRR